MSTIPSFDAFTAYFGNMNIEELLEWLSHSVPVADLSDEQRAFLHTFAQQMLNEQAARQTADQARAQAESQACHFQNLYAQQQQEQQQQQQQYQQQYYTTNQQSQQQQADQQNTNSSGSKLDQALLKGVKPPSFDGTKVVDWIFRVTQYMRALDTDATQEQQLKFAVNLLTGKALTWWRHKLSINSQPYYTFDQLKNALYEEFVDIDHVNKLRDQIDTLSQQNGQNASKYSQRFRELQIELGPYALTDENALHKYMKGLNNQLRIFVAMGHPDTLDDAMQAAVRLETTINGSLSTQRGQQVNGDKMDLGALMFNNKPRKQGNWNKPNYPRKPNSNNNSYQNKANSKNKQNMDWKKNAECHFCGKKGHIKPECFSYLRQQGKPLPKGGATSKPKGGGGRISLAEQVAQLSAELATMKAAPSSSKN